MQAALNFGGVCVHGLLFASIIAVGGKESCLMFLLLECLKIMVGLAASRLGSSSFCLCSTSLGLKLISP